VEGRTVAGLAPTPPATEARGRLEPLADSLLSRPPCFSPPILLLTDKGSDIILGNASRGIGQKNLSNLPRWMGQPMIEKRLWMAIMEWHPSPAKGTLAPHLCHHCWKILIRTSQIFSLTLSSILPSRFFNRILSMHRI
jgi:hypothetical protein